MSNVYVKTSYADFSFSPQILIEMDFLLLRIFTSVFTALHNYSEAKHQIYVYTVYTYIFK